MGAAMKLAGDGGYIASRKGPVYEVTLLDGDYICEPLSPAFFRELSAAYQRTHKGTKESEV
jgi:hypothetical protein